MPDVIMTELDGRILVVTFDDPAKGANVLNKATMGELAAVLERAETDNGVAAVLIRSGKPGMFIAGADLKELDSAGSVQELHTWLKAGQELFNRIDRLKKPTLAAISGICLGGGLELALACDYRVAADTPATSIGLPETKLGLIPGWGGTQRLTKLIGPRRAITMILKGERVSARAARDAGIVGDAVAPHALDRVCREVLARAIASGGIPSGPKRKRTIGEWFLEGPLGRTLLFRKAREAAAAETRGRYPAVEAAIDAVETGIRDGTARGLEVEGLHCAEMAFTPAGKSLRRIFFLTEGAKRKARSSFKAQRAAVLGAGTMGAAIAAVLAGSGAQVRLRDVKEEFLAKGLERIRGMFAYDVKKKVAKLPEAEEKFRRITPTTTWTGLSDVEIVIEAVLEDIAVKRAAFAELDAHVSDGCILATNTSALDLDELAAGTKKPQRVVGIHFFNPVERMPLVEVVRGKATSDEALAAALGVVRQLGKVPVIVKNRPGFLVNRILGPYLVEAGWLLLQLGSPRALDEAAKDFGMPMGPMELLDTIGIEVAASVVKTLQAAFGPRLAPAGVFEKMIELKWLGKKSGTGFYSHDGGEPTVNVKLTDVVDAAVAAEKPPAFDPREALVFAGPRLPDQTDLPSATAARLVFPMINEAARALDEGVCESPDDVDLAMVLGTGFAPFRGGLWHYATALGLRNVVAQLEAWQTRFGPRFEPSEALKKFAAAEPTPAVEPTPAAPPEVPPAPAPAV
jgi:3-hydroxyacyl-CoA dehydrogenase/enoyl-CoA hydratase/3-hydroxybutyryl-CoA epimerase